MWSQLYIYLIMDKIRLLRATMLGSTAGLQLSVSSCIGLTQCAVCSPMIISDMGKYRHMLFS